MTKIKMDGKRMMELVAEYKKSIRPGGKRVETRSEFIRRTGISEAALCRFSYVFGRGAETLIELVETNRVAADAAEIFVRRVPDKKEQSEIIERNGVQGIVNIVKGTPDQARTAISGNSRNVEEPDEVPSSKFLEMEAAIEKDYQAKEKQIDEFFQGATEICIPATKSSKISVTPTKIWCYSCEWVFASWLPLVAKACPYCKGRNIKIID